MRSLRQPQVRESAEEHLQPRPTDGPNSSKRVQGGEPNSNTLRTLDRKEDIKVRPLVFRLESRLGAWSITSIQEFRSRWPHLPRGLESYFAQAAHRFGPQSFEAIRQPLC